MPRPARRIGTIAIRSPIRRPLASPSGVRTQTSFVGTVVVASTARSRVICPTVRRNSGGFVVGSRRATTWCATSGCDDT